MTEASTATANVRESSWLRMLQLSSIPTIEMGRLLGEVWNVAQRNSGLMPVRPNHLTYAGVAEAMLDHTFTLTMNALTGIPDREQMDRQRAEMRAVWGLLEEAGWLDDPASFHQDPPPVSDWTEDRESTRIPSRFEFSRISFDSEYQPRAGMPGTDRWMERHANRTHHAYVLEHEDGGDRPWLVCIHGFGMGSPAVNFAGFGAQYLHHTLGLNLIFPTLPLHGLRSSTSVSGGDLLHPDYVGLLHSFTQAIWDIRRTIQWVRAGGGEKIGLYGLSLGGCNSALVASLEKDLSCVIAGIPVVDFTRVARSNAPWVVDWYHSGSTDWNLMSSVMRVVSPLALEPRLERDRRFIFAGRADRVVPPDQARSLWTHWGQPDIHWYPGGHVFGFMTAEVRRFVEESLYQSDMVAA